MLNVCVQLSAAVNVTVSFSAPSASNLTVADAAGVPTHAFVTLTVVFSVFVFVTLKPFVASPVTAES